ncbi:hypothetical protein FACS1894158_10290 [Betaproteobacteria bacterium]|nr:hypothetical protein FACS1894158_10290 [Betaproteobacteria bacterium]GHU19991.1 hypothetical protein FACS189475_08160 [Betaproteobacteria bacterium]
MTIEKLSTDAVKIRAIAASDREAGLYAVFGEGRLFTARIGSPELREVARLDAIREIEDDPESRWEDKELAIALYYHHPYVCVTERYGLNAALVNLETGAVRAYKREPYHCDVSSYAAGFLDRDGRTLFICQTAWNRLDIFDAETDACLTEREIICRNIQEGYRNEDGKWIDPVYERKNYLDYFHSLLQVAPDGQHFLSNGWVWGPMDGILLFSTEQFLQEFEPGYYHWSYMCDGYNWDRPCAFINNDLFVIALDDALKTGNLEADEKEAYVYQQLAFIRPADTAEAEDHRVKLYRGAVCDAFAINNGGAVQGLLYYDREKNYLVALCPLNGAGAYSLDGKTIWRLPEIKPPQSPFFSEYESGWAYSPDGWAYSPEHHVFYTWRDGKGVAEAFYG